MYIDAKLTEFYYYPDEFCKELYKTMQRQQLSIMIKKRKGKMKS